MRSERGVLPMIPPKPQAAKYFPLYSSIWGECDILVAFQLLLVGEVVVVLRQALIAITI